MQQPYQLSRLISLLTALFCLTPASSLAADQNLEQLAQSARAWLERQAVSAWPGVEAQARMAALDARLRFPACDAVEFVLPAGARLQGRGSLGARCTAPKAWTLYLNYDLVLRGPALVTKRALEAGQPLAIGDLEKTVIRYQQAPAAHLAELPAGGQLRRDLGAGQALTQDVLVMPEVIKAGQSVLIRARGGGFVVTQEGKAQSSARAGDKVRVKTPSGRLITGIATLDGQVQVSP